MKKIFSMMLAMSTCLLMQTAMYAQDSAKPAAVKQINASSEQADKLQGKKIQQQSLSGKTFESLDTLAVNKPKKKKHPAYRRKHS